MEKGVYISPHFRKKSEKREDNRLAKMKSQLCDMKKSVGISFLFFIKQNTKKEKKHKSLPPEKKIIFFPLTLFYE